MKQEGEEEDDERAASSAATASAPGSSGWLTPERRIAAGLFALGAAVRAAMLVAQPQPMVWFDLGTYLQASLPGAPPPIDRPQGYSWFLRGLRLISTDLWLIQAAQMMLGMTTFALLYGTARRLAPRPGWAPLAALGLCLLWPTNLLLETYALSEALFLFLVALAGFTAIEGWRRRSPWLLGAAGLVAGASATVRVVGLLFCGLLGLLALGAALRGDSGAPGGRARRLVGPGALCAGSALGVLLYLNHYHAHHGVWAMESWAGINRYCLLAPLVKPEHAAPDERSVALLRAHGEGNLGGFDFVMWDDASPLAIAGRELGLGPPALDRWAGRIALRAAIDDPGRAMGVLGENLVRAATFVDPLDQHVKLGPKNKAHYMLLGIHGVDVSSWHEQQRFRLPWRGPLTVLKPVLVACAVAAVALQLSRRHRRFYQLAFGASALLFLAAVSVSILPEQRHVHVAENLMLVNAALLAGQLLWSLRRAAPPPTPP